MSVASARSLIATVLTLNLGLASMAAVYAATNDPMGDMFGSAAVSHDIANLSAVVTPTTVSFTVDFFNEIAAPSAFQPSSVVGYIDIDQDETTGALAKKSEFSPNGDSHLGVE